MDAGLGKDVVSNSEGMKFVKKRCARTRNKLKPWASKKNTTHVYVDVKKWSDFCGSLAEASRKPRGSRNHTFWALAHSAFNFGPHCLHLLHLLHLLARCLITIDNSHFSACVRNQESAEASRKQTWHKRCPRKLRLWSRKRGGSTLRL